MDTSTGEVVNGVTIMTSEERERRKEYYKERDELLKRRSGYNDLKNFIFYLHRSTNGFHDLRPQTAARLIYLATFLSYKNNILYSTQKSEMNKQSMQELVGLKRKAFNSFYDEVVAADLLQMRDGHYTINQSAFVRGKLTHTDYAVLTKIYMQAMRELYASTDISMHQYLGYVFLMIPFVNTEWNVLCKNPMEKDRNKIELMSVGEFCDEIGYDRGNAKRLIQNYRNITFNWKGEQQRFCTFVYEEDRSNMSIFINPNIFYTGKHADQVEAFGMFFKKKSAK